MLVQKRDQKVVKIKRNEWKMKGESSGRLFMYIWAREADGWDHTNSNSSDPVIIPKLNVLGLE